MGPKSPCHGTNVPGVGFGSAEGHLGHGADHRVDPVHGPGPDRGHVHGAVGGEVHPGRAARRAVELRLGSSPTVVHAGIVDLIQALDAEIKERRAG
jgi:hypothetical protein